MKTAIATLIAIGVLSACASYSAGPAASAQLQATTGNSVAGWVKFAQAGDKVRVSGEVSGLAPNTAHGFHIHDKGDCSSGDGMSTGGHFNPEGHPHGGFDAAEHHAGDLKSLQSDSNGVAKFQYEISAVTVGSGVTDVVGHGLIVHRDPDDMKTQPTGNSGPRLACAVIHKD